MSDAPTGPPAWLRTQAPDRELEWSEQGRGAGAKPILEVSLGRSK
jgi:hypothetical protein